MLTQRMLAAFFALGAGSVAAQEMPPPPGRAGFFVHRAGVELSGPPDVMFLGGHGAFEREVVKGAPFTADTVTEIAQTLADGNRLVRKTTGRMARDNEGRVRREQTLAAIGGLLAGPEPPRFVVIHDPVAKQVFFVHDDVQRAVRLPRDDGGPPGPDGPRGDFFHKRIDGPEPLPEPTSEALGTRDIEGLRAEGSRQTLVLPAGHIGNEKPIEVVSEQWRSVELDVMVRTRYQDPRFGVTEYRLENVQRGEPDPSLFQVPAGYKIDDGPGGFGFRRNKR